MILREGVSMVVMSNHTQLPCQKETQPEITHSPAALRLPYGISGILHFHFEALHPGSRRTAAAVEAYAYRFRSDTTCKFRLHTLDLDSSIHIHRDDGMNRIDPRNERHLATDLRLELVGLKVFPGVFSVRTG